MNNQKVKDASASYADYNKFAWLYDEEWGYFGSRIFDVLYRMTGERIAPEARILDLCCGTGQLAKVLSEKGYQVTGLDGSAEMLRYAKKNVPHCKFILKDARTFQFPTAFDVVFSTFDSLNHLMSSKDLKKVFQNVYNCLVAEGVFVFDLNTLKAYKTQWEGYVNVVEKSNSLYVNRAYYDAKRRIAQTHCLIFRRLQGTWGRTDVKLYQKYHAASRVQSLLEKIGFVQIHKYALNNKHGYHEFAEEDTRVFFVGRKP
jgi:SAM-dependent methyltransferase